jgi:hypothetical protein
MNAMLVVAKISGKGHQESIEVGFKQGKVFKTSGTCGGLYSLWSTLHQDTTVRVQSPDS